MERKEEGVEEGRKKGRKGNIYWIPVPRYLATHTNFCFLICLIIIHQSKNSNVLKMKKLRLVEMN